jgi:predicted nucleic acid binding AN1-type Zn finger protein
MNTPDKLPKNRCHYCNKRFGSISTECKSCSHTFCLKCIQHEVHKCSHFQEYKKQLVNQLTNKLENERTKSVKITVI